MTVTLPSALVRRLSKESADTSISRSAVVEEWLLVAERQKEQARLRKELEEYYSVPESADEQAASRALYELSKKAMAASDAEDEEYERRRKRK
jgi:hypothetical protein